MKGKLYLGSMGWSYKFWPLYKEASKPSEYLPHYADHFNSVEVNNTFYRIPSRTTVKSWYDEVHNGFIFSSKFPRSISHTGSLNYDEERLSIFLRNISELKEKKGPLLLQLPPYSGPEDLDHLENLLDALPREDRYAVEFRNKKWLTEKTYNILKLKGVATVLQEHPTFPDVDTLTGDFVYIRCEGDRKKVNGEKGEREVDRAKDTEKWAKRIQGFLSEGLDVFCYFSKYYSGYPPLDISDMRETLITLEKNYS
jgi:uncharacterized protein YecE (DUF72 family)